MNSLSIRLLLGSFMAISFAPLQAQTATWNDGGNDQSWSDPANWHMVNSSGTVVSGEIPGVALQPPSPGSAPSTTSYSVVIGTLTSSSLATPIILDTGSIVSSQDGAVSIPSLTFDNTTGVEISSDGVSFLSVTSGITNAEPTAQNLALTVSTGATATFAGGPTGGNLTFTASSDLIVGTSNIATTGTVNVMGSLDYTFNAIAAGQVNTTFGKIGVINASGATIRINNLGGTYSATATLAADTGDFFQLTTGNFAGATMQAPPVFTATTLTWITSLYLKGILFVEPTAGGNVINAAVVLPIGNDSEFNPKGTAAFNVTFNGGELLTNTNSGTLDTGGTAGTAYSTTNTMGINAAGGTIAATTGSTATYGGLISNGTGTGTLTIGDSTNTGTVVFTDANTYTGVTTISSGTFVAGNTTGSASGTGSVTVGNNKAVATLAGTGTISGKVTTATTGTNVAHIAPGATPGTVGTLHTGSLGLTIGTGTALDFDLSSTSSVAGGANNDLIAMGGGTLTLSGTTTVNFNVANQSPTIGTAYTLINGATSISSFNASNFISTGIGVLVPIYSTSATSLQVTFKNSQTITSFPTIGNQSYSGTPVMITLSATASSGLAVTYAVTTGSSIASITGSTLTITGSGSVTVTASQAGNSTFAPATPVAQSFTVSAVTVSFANWETNNGLTTQNGFTAAQVAPTGSAFNDGVPNLLKYLYDINPAQPITINGWAAMPVVDSFISSGTQYVTLTYRQFALVSGSSVTVNVQTSSDLQTWTTLTQSQTATTATGFYTLQQVGNDPNTGDPIMQVQAAYTGTRQFIRLNVTQ